MYRTKEEVTRYTVFDKTNIKDAIKKMDELHRGVIFVVDVNNKLVGIVTDGDFRRSILSGMSLEDNITRLMNSKPITLLKHLLNTDAIKSIFYCNSLL